MRKRRVEDETSSLFPFKTGRCAAISSAQNWQKPERPSAVQRNLATSGLHGRVAGKTITPSIRNWGEGKKRQQAELSSALRRSSAANDGSASTNP